VPEIVIEKLLANEDDVTRKLDTTKDLTLSSNNIINNKTHESTNLG